MKSTPVTTADLENSVIAVPPLARNADLSLNRAANLTLIRHIEAGGITSLMYGGNANFYHLPLSEYADTLDFLAEAAGPDTWVLPSVGSDHGRMMDQAVLLRNRKFPTAMLLPHFFPHTVNGLASGIRRFTDVLGKPAVLYIKSDNYLPADVIANLRSEGRLASIKYASVRENPAKDSYLRELVNQVGRDIIVSGIGERPVIEHFRDFGLTSMTSGSCCVAPRGTAQLLSLLQQKRFDEAEVIKARYIPLEDCRDSISPIRVLHDAVTLAGIADMGPMLPLLSNLTLEEADVVGPAARQLLTSDLANAEAGAA